MSEKLENLQRQLALIMEKQIKPLFNSDVKVAILFSIDDQIASSGMVTDMSDVQLGECIEYLMKRPEDVVVTAPSLHLVSDNGPVINGHGKDPAISHDPLM